MTSTSRFMELSRYFWRVLGEVTVQNPKDPHLFTGISKERQARIRKHIAQEISDELREKLTPKIRAQVTQQLRDKLLAEVRRTVEQEAEAARPSTRERLAFQEFVKEVELDAYAQASVASLEADRSDRSLQRLRRWRVPACYLLGLGFIPIVYALYHLLGLSLSFTVAFMTTGLTLGALIWSTLHQTRWYERALKTQREVASNYMLVAEEAKAYRVVHAERLDTKRELDGLVEQLKRSKSQLDREYHPRVDELEVARVSARHRIAVEEPYREFDARLAEAEAEADEETDGVRRRRVGG